jgi:DNA-binding response OmpR family regulator
MGKTPKIVVIDDDMVTLKVLSVVLNSEDVQIHVATDAATGYQMVQNENPRLIILDVYMPDKDGLSLLADFRRDPATKNTPVLMLSNEEKIKGAGLAIELGADAYLTKPFNPVQLRQKISDLLHR